MRELLSKLSIRAYIAFLFTSLFAFIVIYIIARSNVDLRVSGSIDVNMLLTVLVNIIMVIIGWVFGRRST